MLGADGKGGDKVVLVEGLAVSLVDGFFVGASKIHTAVDVYWGRRLCLTVAGLFSRNCAHCNVVLRWFSRNCTHCNVVFK